jgi:hypothetical protein
MCGGKKTIAMSAMPMQMRTNRSMPPTFLLNIPRSPFDAQNHAAARRAEH